MGLLRDRVTWLAYAQAGLYGWFLYAFGPSVPLLRDEQGVSRAVSGLHGTMLAAGAVTAGVAQATAIRRLGRGGTLWTGIAGMCAGVVLLTATSALPLTLLGAYVAGSFGSLTLNAIGAVLAEHHGRGGPAALSEANAMAAGLGTISPLVVGLGVALGLGWRPALLLVLPFSLLVWLALRSVRVPDPVAIADSPGAAAGRLPRPYWIAWAVLVCVIAAEFCFTIWATDLLRERTGVSAGAASAALSALVVGVAVGRVVGGRLALVRSADRLLMEAIAVALVGWALFWLASGFAVAVAGLAVVGLGISLHYPLGVVRSFRVSDGLIDIAAGRNSLAGGLAIGIAPFGLGALADVVGVRAAFLVVPVLLGLAAVGVLAGRRALRRPAAAGAA